MKRQLVSILVGILIFTPLQAGAHLSSIEQAIVDAERDAKQNISPITWGTYGCACALVALPHALIGTPDIPVYTLIGKSPAYINTYILLYQHKATHRRLEAAAIGCGLGSVLSGTFWLFLCL